MTKKEILKLLEPFGDEAEIFIDYKGTLKLSLSILNDCEKKASSVKHIGETIKVDFGSRSNYGMRVFTNKEDEDEIEGELCFDIHVPRTVCEFPKFRKENSICKECPLK